MRVTLGGRRPLLITAPSWITGTAWITGPWRPGAGPVESWVQLLRLEGPLVSFPWTYRFGADGQVLASDSTLRFRGRAEVEEDLAGAGFVLEEVRGAPDRPGRELVFVARRP